MSSAMGVLITRMEIMTEINLKSIDVVPDMQIKCTQ